MSLAVPPPTAQRRRKPLLVKPANIEGMEAEERYKPIEWPLVRRLLGVLAPYRKQYAFGLLLGRLRGPMWTKSRRRSLSKSLIVASA